MYNIYMHIPPRRSGTKDKHTHCQFDLRQLNCLQAKNIIMSFGDRETTLEHRDRNTIEYGMGISRQRLNSLPPKRDLPQLTIHKNKRSSQTLGAKFGRRISENAKLSHKLDQFYDIFPRKLSTIEPKSHHKSIYQPQRNIGSASILINRPMVLRSNPDLGEPIAVRKPFSQQVRKRRIMAKFKHSKHGNAEVDDNLQGDPWEEGLFTFYPKGKGKETINQFLQIQ